MTINQFTLVRWGLAVVLTAVPAVPQGSLRSSRQGGDLETRLARDLETLRSDLLKRLPKPSARTRAAYAKARAAETVAAQSLEAARQALGKVRSARALVGHAKGKWIGGANRGIARATAMLEKASNATERSAAQRELDKWQANRRAGEQALAERQAALDKALREQPRLTKAVQATEKALARAESQVRRAVRGLGANAFLDSDRLDARFAEFLVLFEGTPRRLARFAGQGGAQRELIEKLLADGDLMLQMVIADGAKGGRYGPAMAIYTAIQAASRKARQGTLQRLAVAIALEHAVPVSQRSAKADMEAPATVDPVARYLHYEKAFVAGELDPGFGKLSVWDYRMVVDGNEPDETLAWGREMLRSYRPDHVYTADARWRYVAAVRTDVRYGSQDNKYDKPELQFFQNILMNGGVCGRRAFFGRFILRAFGVPTTARPQRGHAALAHWTPAGWVVCLGGGWGSGWTKTRYKNDLDFLATTQARASGKRFLQVKRAQWAGDVVGEKRVFGLRSGNPGFWYGVSLERQRALAEKAETLAPVGEELGEANESKVRYATEAATLTEDDRTIVVGGDGVITVPAVACSKPTKSTRKILFLPSNLGGKQLHYGRTGRAQGFEYTLDVPRAGRYSLSARVASPSWRQRLRISVNEGRDPVALALPHTVGLWGSTGSVEIDLVAGRNVLRFSHESEGYAKGFSIKDFTLTPARRPRP